MIKYLQLQQPNEYKIKIDFWKSKNNIKQTIYD